MRCYQRIGRISMPANRRFSNTSVDGTVWLDITITTKLTMPRKPVRPRLPPSPDFELAFSKLKYVRLSDVQAISDAAGIPPRSDRTGAQIRNKINTVFQLAFLDAAKAEVGLEPFETREMAREITGAARRLLKALGYPDDPELFTHDSPYLELDGPSDNARDQHSQIDD